MLFMCRGYRKNIAGHVGCTFAINSSAYFHNDLSQSKTAATRIKPDNLGQLLTQGIDIKLRRRFNRSKIR
jgi:hypothetical protein